MGDDNCYLNDANQECLRCRVEGGCNETDEKCGIRRGVEYGIYPKWMLHSPRGVVPKEIKNQNSCGKPEQPLYKLGDGMNDFCLKVQRYREPWMRGENFDINSDD